MNDREKVMQWLKICANGCKDGCPYEYKNLVYRVECKADLMSDALELLKEQESITKTPEVIKTDTPETQPPRAPKVLKYTRPASEFTSLKENIYLYYCGWCGIDIRRGDHYCRNCGRKVDWNDRQRENDS